MKLIEQLLAELGADCLKSITWIPCGCCYLKSVKEILDYTPQKVVVRVGKLTITLTGQNLRVGSYFEGDALVEGEVTCLEAQ